MKPAQPWQPKKVGKTSNPMLNYLYRLKKRMSQTGYGKGDPSVRPRVSGV